MNNDSDEQNEFEQAMIDVTRLKDERVTPVKKKPRPVKLNLTIDDNEDDSFADMNIETGDELSFQRPGIQNRLFSDLKRGYIEPEATLDLHGMRVTEASQSMNRFLKNALKRRLRCVLVIHGKGQGSKGQQPVLKQKTNQWLRQRDEVLAFTSAPRWNGGTGATYVLLSRKWTDENY
jgi:DNA-nicking Smr family endonuclease